jgi:predicted SAM-dependent methyltransferase
MIKRLVKSIIGKKASARLKQSKNAILFRGTAFVCPICNSRLRKFLPGERDFPVNVKYKVVGAGFFENLSCPVCQSYNRDRLLFLFLKRRTEILRSSLKVLHIAPEKKISEVLKGTGLLTYLSADIQSPLADVKMDITKIQFPDETFDVVICNHVLEHVSDDSAAMSELYRVIKIGGWAVLQVPLSYILEKTYEDFLITDPKGREEHFGQYDHVRIYGLDYFTRLESAGFVVETVEAKNFLTDHEILKYGVIEEEKIVFCKKVK